MESYRPGDEARKILKPETMAMFEPPYRLSRAVHDCGARRRILPILDRWAVSEPERLLALEASDTWKMQKLQCILNEIPTDYEIDSRAAKQASLELDVLTEYQAMRMMDNGVTETEILQMRGVEMGLAPASVINAEDWSEEEEDDEDEEDDLSDLE